MTLPEANPHDTKTKTMDAHLQTLLFLHPLLFAIRNKGEDGSRFILLILCSSLDGRFLTHNTLRKQ